VTRVGPLRIPRLLASEVPWPAVQYRTALDTGLPVPGRCGRHDHCARTKVFAGQRAEGFYVDLGAISTSAI